MRRKILGGSLKLDRSANSATIREFTYRASHAHLGALFREVSGSPAGNPRHGEEVIPPAAKCVR